MSVVHAPLRRPGASHPTPAASTVRAMEIGQHVIAVVLTAIGVSRAIGEGVAPPAAVITGLAILGWHTAGTILPARTGSPRLPVWWLLGFAVIWVAAVAVSDEFVWLSNVRTTFGSSSSSAGRAS